MQTICRYLWLLRFQNNRLLERTSFYCLVQIRDFYCSKSFACELLLNEHAYLRRPYPSCLCRRRRRYPIWSPFERNCFYPWISTLNCSLVTPPLWNLKRRSFNNLWVSLCHILFRKLSPLSSLNSCPMRVQPMHSTQTFLLKKCSGEH